MTSVSRREFARLLAITGSASFITSPPTRWISSALPATPPEPDEKFWKEVRARFLLPDDLVFLNAANLCPTSTFVIEALERNTRFLDANPSSASRSRLSEGREESRRMIAKALGVTAEEIVITRNTSEANNLVSSGLDLKSGDDVVVFADNHPSNLTAWRQKAERFAFSVTEVAAENPHPGAEAYIDAFSRAMTPRTRVVAMTHVTNTIGDRLPVEELCRIARERGVLSVVDGAQTFGALDVNVRTLGADFYTGSAHKWPCGPKETGVLFVRNAVHDRIHPSLVSLYPGAVGISRKLEGFGQRDEAALATLGAAISLQNDIGRAVIETRVRQLVQRLANGLRTTDGVTLWTNPDPRLSAGIVVFKPASREPRRVAARLYDQYRVACASAGGSSRPGVRFSPHFYNTLDEMDRVIDSVKRVVAA